MNDEVRMRLHDNECELNVLSVLLNYPNMYAESADIISAESFDNPRHAAIYKAIAGVVEEGDAPDSITVFQYTQKHPTKENITIDDIILCNSYALTSAYFWQHCARLKDLQTRRKMYLIGYKLYDSGLSELGETEDIRQQAIEALQALDDVPQKGITSTGEALKALDQIVQGNITGEHPKGTPTGFSYLDDKGGLQPGDLVVIGGDTSQGKTSLAIDLCVNAAKHGAPCAFYSTEMISTQLAARMVAAESGISSKVIMQKPLTSEQLQTYDRTLGKLEGLPIYFDDNSGLSVERIIASIRTLARKKNVKVAFVDYLQVLQNNRTAKNETEEQFFGASARRFKNLAKELQICIVVLSQLSRNSNSHEPTNSRIRGSGQICEAADNILLIYRPENYGQRYGGAFANVSTIGTALIKQTKGRNVGVGNFIVGFNADLTHFYELETLPRTENMQWGDGDEPF